MARKNHIDGLFATLSQKLLRCGAYGQLSPYSKLAIIELEMHYWESNRVNPIQLPERWLADALGCNAKTARKAIGELDDFGFIALERIGKLKGPLKGRAATYRLTWHPDNEGCKATHDYLGWQSLMGQRNALKNGASTRTNSHADAPKNGATRSDFWPVENSLSKMSNQLKTYQNRGTAGY